VTDLFSLRPRPWWSSLRSKKINLSWISVLAFLILVPAAAAQGVGDFLFGDLRAEIADLRSKLARCGGPPACPERTLLQAKLNQLLKMGVMMGEMMGVGDPDVAGTPPRPPALKPTDATDYMSMRTYLAPTLAERLDRGYIVSEPRVSLAIIDHCLAMKDLGYLGSMLTREEDAARRSPAGQAETKANVIACIGEHDAKEVSANRKAAMEYCLQANNWVTGGKGTAPFDACMDRHDMLQAMCKQELELRVEYMMRSPGIPRAPQTCQGVRINQQQSLTILSGPAAGAMAELPAKFLAPPPDLSLPLSAPPVAIPAGTVLATTLQHPGVNAVSIEQGNMPNARLDAPLAVGGQVILTAGTYIFLKARIIGPGTPPNSVQIGLTTTSAMLADQKRMELKSDELIFTILRQPPSPFVRQPPALAGFSAFIPSDTKLRFTLKP
jgi:hypothetical protein